MRSKKELCQNWKLYIITDRICLRKKTLVEAVREAVLGGAGVVQLRDKSARDEEFAAQARELLLITRSLGVPLIINDRIEIARQVGADGVHLGQDDASLEAARMILGANAIVGRSTHSVEQARRAQSEGFDYIGVGPVFATPTKPSYEPVGLDLVRLAAQILRIPFVAIGGIDEKNAFEVRKAGAKTVAVVRAVMASENPKLTAENLCKIMA